MNTLNKFSFKHAIFKCTALAILLSASDLIAICPSGITAIAYFDTNEKELSQLQEEIASTIKMGLDYIAIDLNVTADDNTAVLSSQTLNQIQPVDNLGVSNGKFPDNFAPLLQQILSLPLEKMGVVVMINEDSLPSDLFTKILAEMVNKYNKTKKGYPVLVGTFSPHIAIYLKRYFPELPFIAFAKTQAKLFNLLKYEPKIYALSAQIATPELITQFNNESRAVWIFNLNDPNEMEKFAKKGPIGIITKDAEALIKLRNQLNKECQNLINTKKN